MTPLITTTTTDSPTVKIVCSFQDPGQRYAYLYGRLCGMMMMVEQVCRQHNNTGTKIDPDVFTNAIKDYRELDEALFIAIDRRIKA
jgi:hypothetical protein